MSTMITAAALEKKTPGARSPVTGTAKSSVSSSAAADTAAGDSPALAALGPGMSFSLVSVVVGRLFPAGGSPRLTAPPSRRCCWCWRCSGGWDCPSC